MSNLMVLPEAFNELYEPLITGRSYIFKVYYGGRSSCKSHSAARALLSLGMEKQLRILCLREFYSSIKDSVKSLLDDIIKEYNLGYFYKSLEREINGINGTTIIFGGLKVNNQNIKGKEKIDYVWCEEAERISETSWQLLIPTIVRNTGAEIWITFNPYKETDSVYQRFIVNEDPDVLLRKVSWRDNPFRNSATIREMIKDRDRDEDTYNWIWEGKCLKISEAVIFKNVKVESFDTPDDAFFYYGMDFGFEDPTTITRCYVNNETRTLYIDKAAKIDHITIDRIPAFVQENIPDAMKQKIFADSAKPDTIKYLSNNGLPRIIGAKKGPGSIDEGIQFLKSYDIVIHSSLKDVKFEFDTYSYKVDPISGIVDFTKIVDKNNHYIDAIRYSIERLRKPIKQMQFASVN